MTRWLPRGLSSRIIGLTLLALLVSQAVSYFSFRHGREDLIERMISGYMSQAVVALNRSLQFVEPAHRGRMVRSLSSRFARYELVAQPPACPSAGDDSGKYIADFAERMDVSAERVRVCVGPGVIQRTGHRRGRRTVVVAFQRAPDEWLLVQQSVPGQPGYWAWRSLRNLIITLLIMTVLVILATRRFTRPLRDLATAAERFGRGEKIKPIPVRGSDEIRRSIVEFNHMHERIDRFVAERSRLVAALAHDLRTPITALRLRLEFLPDDENTRAMRATLDDMAQMSEAALTFMREEASVTPARRVDLTALVDAVCEDYRATGSAVSFTPEASVVLVCRPVAIRRALRNVIDNALAYGRCAEVTLVDAGERVTIDIADRGPGIAEAEMASVFDAFVRLETSRSRETGGAGLGLSIARSVIRGHGGDITLRNRSEGGLSVRMTLPRARFTGSS